VSNHVPEGWPTVVPRISAEDPESLVVFVHEVFDATGEFQAERPTELRIGDSLLMIGGTIERGEKPAFLYVYVPDTDATWARAIERGAESLEEPVDMPYGDRRAMVADRWGNTWQIATHSGRFTP